VARRFGAAWALEAGNVFYTQLPNLLTGTCPASTMPVYRLFNNRADVNHRYTTDPAVREAMLEAGYAAEGYGESTVAFCVPFPGSPAGTSATFSAIATAPDTISFSATSSFANGETASSYTWAFGDGSTATGATTSHKYAIAGTHTVVLIVKGTKGSSVVAVKGVTVTVDTPLAPPAASIIVTVRGPASFDFGSTASPSTGAVLVAHTWN
jgi:PKD repeat protein